eukprot:a515909_186.p1 GENE.a515909_186~~a515909_186.p1  ORF type:complete len:162 (+),score=53.98 a515909_186:50-487(+)
MIPEWAFRVSFYTILLFAIWSPFVIFQGTSFLLSAMMWIALGFVVILMPSSALAVEVFAFSLLLSILVDIVTTSTFVDSKLGDQAKAYQFAFAATVMTLILKPVLVVVTFFEYMRRGGSIQPPVINTPSGTAVVPTTADGHYQQI